MITILYVDEDPIMCSLVPRIFEKAGVSQNPWNWSNKPVDRVSVKKRQPWNRQ
jgi:hypothetical protein